MIFSVVFFLCACELTSSRSFCIYNANDINLWQINPGPGGINFGLKSVNW